MERRDQQTPDWSNINPDLLECILKKLPLPAVIRCRSVCSKWRSTTKALLLSPPNPPPMLMLRRKFHNLFGEEDYLGGGGHLFLNLAAPAQEPGSYAGSDEDDLAACVPMGQVTDGWMVSKDRNDRLYMLNPSSFGTVSCLRFPPIEYPGENDHVSERRPEVRIPQKVVFWGNPVLGGECSMAFLCACSSLPAQRLYFAISDGPDFDYRLNLGLLSDSAFVKDIICINNRLYAVTSTGYIEAWDCCGNIRHRTTFSKTTDTTTTVTTYDAPTRTTTVVKTTDTTTTTTVTTNDAPTLTTTIIKTTDTTTVTTVTSKDAPKLVFSFQPSF